MPAKKKKRGKKRAKSRKKELRERNLNPETRRGVFIIILFVIGLISLLALLDLAGTLGVWITFFITLIFGWGEFLLPAILIILGTVLIFEERFKVTAMNYIGLLFFVLSLLGVVHLIGVDPAAMFAPIKEGQGGGYLGLALSFPLFKIMGFWAALIVLAGLFVISLLVMFNTTLSQLLDHTFLRGFFSRLSELLGRLPLVGQRYEVEDKEDYRDDEEDEEDKKKAVVKQPLFGKKKIKESLVQEQPVLPSFTPPVKPRKYKIDLPIDLLNGRPTKPVSGDIKTNQLVIKKTLENFGIEVEMGSVQVGPTVTQYTLKPSEGVKLAQITTLHNDLALALAAHPIRIEAPIPGKALVGIEVPNRSVAIVNLKEVLLSEEFRNRTSNLMVGLGKDVAGNPWLADLARMPHMLIAGATNSGKTVMINSLLLTLLYQNNPHELKFILVDPKRVELPLYDGIPHLITPVITEVQKTINALKWTINEMERRFELLSKMGKRNVQTYNREMAEKLPYIVFVIDELADLMVTAGVEVEAAIIRLAQMARAVGIHLILATQRPSVDIITGLIKANITTRLAFSVASLVDSRTILDTAGAEKLLGRGDMLYISSDLSKPKRLQGAYVADEEIKKVVDFLKGKAVPDYNEEITSKQVVSRISGGKLGDSEGDELLDEAKEVIKQAGKASASLLQRRLRVGYARAARILDLLEGVGFIGPADGAKPREMLSDYEEDDIIEASLDKYENQASEEIEEKGEGVEDDDEKEENVDNDDEKEEIDDGLEEDEYEDENKEAEDKIKSFF